MSIMFQVGSMPQKYHILNDLTSLGHSNLFTCLTSSVGRKLAILEFKKKLKNVTFLFF